MNHPSTLSDTLTDMPLNAPDWRARGWRVPTWGYLALLAMCLFALWLRAPRVGEGLPFFYREDEAHHFNRLAEMVKSGSFDPVYFHKPSLHFYLRMPVFGASFLWTVKKGAIRSVQEVGTRDDYGVGDYAFSASHPGIVKWSRSFTVLLGLALVPLAFLIALQLSSSTAGALLAASAVAVSPSLIEEGAVIGVDILMATMCLLSVALALRLFERFSLSALWICSLCCGLAVSSKYNAAPIALLPVAVCLLSRRISWSTFAACAAGPALGFLAATPYLFAHFPLFLDQVAYEIWHYGVAGHAGYMAEPGWAQFVFYLRWLNFEALGPALTALGVFGALLLWSPSNSDQIDRAHISRKVCTFLLFPVLFGALMIAQKTNFTRNMLVIIPFLSIIASLAFIRSLDALKLEKRPRAFAIVAFILIGLGYPLRESFVARAETLAFVDSRSILGSELLKSGAAQSPENKTQVALSGQLQFPLGMYTSGPFARFNQITSSPLELYGRGFDKLVLSPAWGIAERERSLFATSERILGELKQQRIIHDPAIEILEARPSAALTAALTELATKDRELQIDVLLSPPTGTTKACSVSGGLSPASASETYCWGQGRVVFLRFSDLESALRTAPNTSKVTVYLDAMTPWSGNKIRFFLGNWSETRSFDQGVWASTSIQPPLAAMNAAGGIFVEIEKVLSPKLQGISADDRNLGAAFKNIRLDGSRN